MSLLTDNLVFLRELNILSIVIRFFIACVCGGVIGFERGKKYHAAGLRTHLLVCIGAATVMIVNQYIFEFLSPNTDLSRMGAQVVSGIGFLGAGTILVTGEHRIKGLTTAAGLWACACMGLAAGIGYYECAIILCIFLYIILKIVNVIDERFVKTDFEMQLYIEYDNTIQLSCILKPLKEENWHITSIRYIGTSINNELAVKIEIQRNIDINSLSSPIDLIKNIKGVKFVEKM